MNLWMRIAELEDDGHRFEREPFKTKSGKRGTRYWLLTGLGISSIPGS